MSRMRAGHVTCCGAFMTGVRVCGGEGGGQVCSHARAGRRGCCGCSYRGCRRHHDEAKPCVRPPARRRQRQRQPCRRQPRKNRATPGRRASRWSVHARPHQRWPNSSLPWPAVARLVRCWFHLDRNERCTASGARTCCNLKPRWLPASSKVAWAWLDLQQRTRSRSPRSHGHHAGEMAVSVGSTYHTRNSSQTARPCDGDRKCFDHVKSHTLIPMLLLARYPSYRILHALATR